MKRPVYWIVITLLLCVLLGCASQKGDMAGHQRLVPRSIPAANQRGKPGTRTR